MVGADGAVAGAPRSTTPAGPVPTQLIAETAKRYWSPLVSPVTVHVVGTGVVLEMVTIVVPTVVHVWPPRLAAVTSVAATNIRRSRFHHYRWARSTSRRTGYWRSRWPVTLSGAPGVSTKLHVSDKLVVP